ncbi:MAG TPA: DUF1622 domain-containing protein [Steroidobacteraceae bacterium]|nr:DUF1622 domain-containing protein [Steroidobacteraceae bacterium]
MRELLIRITEPITVAIDAIALLAIVVGTVEVAAKAARAVFRPMSDPDRRDTWLRYARWLVAALTFQLAADIIETSVSTDWQTIGRVGAIAVIRTFLNYFLERDVELQQRACEAAESGPAASRREATR